MDNTIILLFLSILLFVLLIAINCIIFFYSKKAQKSINILLENGKITDLKDVLFNQIEKNKNQDKELKDIAEKIKNLEQISEKSMQKIGIVRFNPFSELGGNQSFVIAILDKQNNGFVLSNLFIKENCRIYTKTIISGKSDYNLSKEEKEAIERAMA